MSSANHFLSPRLYREGLRQLLPMGLLVGILSIGLPLVKILVLVFSGFGGVGSTAYTLSNLTGVSYVMLAVLAVFALVAAFYLFNFQNKRGSADFYHALPVSRSNLYLSFLAPILTWVWGIGLLALLLVVVTALVGGVHLTFALVAVSLGLLLSASLFLIAATLAAVSVTGTWFSNLVVTGLIIFTPYLVTKTFMQLVSGGIPSIPAQSVGAIGSTSIHNSFFLLFVQRVNMVSHYSLASYVASIIVTLVWSFVLIGAGAWFFRRRRSEMAGTSAPTKGFQLICRVVLSIFVVGLLMSSSVTFGGWMIGTGGMSGAIFSVSSLRDGILSLIVALVVFLVFELITTRKWRRLVRAIPSFSLVLAFTAVLFSAAYLYSAHEKRAAPPAGQIASVQILSLDYGVNPVSPPAFDTLFLASSGWQAIPYNQARIQSLMIQDPGVLQAIADKLRGSFDPGALDTGDGSGRVIMLVEARTKKGQKLRRLINVCLGERPDKVAQALLRDPEVMRAILALPQPGKTTVSLSSPLTPFVNNVPKNLRMSNAEKRRIYQDFYRVFYTGYQKLSPEEQYQITGGWFSRLTTPTSVESTTIASFTADGNIRVYSKVGAQPTATDYIFTLPEALNYQWKTIGRGAAAAFNANPLLVHVDEIELFTPSDLAGWLGTMPLSSSASGGNPFWSVISQRSVDSTRDSQSPRYNDPNTTGFSGVDTETIGNAAMQRAEAIICPALTRDFNVDAPVFAYVTIGAYTAKGHGGDQTPLVVPLTAQEANALRVLTTGK